MVWLPGAENALATLWTPTPLRRAISEACNAIDALLRKDPYAHATGVDNYFSVRVNPLVVLFEVREADRVVRVIEVHQVGPEN